MYSKKANRGQKVRFLSLILFNENKRELLSINMGNEKAGIITDPIIHSKLVSVNTNN